MAEEKNVVKEEKAKKPTYKKWWFWLIIVLVVIIIIVAVAGGSEDTASNDTSSETAATEEAIEYKTYDVDTLIDALEANAMNAKNEYDGQYVELKGRLENIDASGDYFTIAPLNDEWAIDSVQCFMDESQQSTLSSYNTGDTITVQGQITDVGEIMGYSLDLHAIVE